MNRAKNYFTVDELQQICEKLDLSTDGLKSELIKNILDYSSTDSDISRISVFRAKIPTSQTSGRSTQTPDLSYQLSMMSAAPTITNVKNSMMSFRRF